MTNRAAGRWGALLGTLAIVALAAPALAAEVVEVRVGNHPTYTRVVFELDAPAGYRIERHEDAGAKELLVTLEAGSTPRSLETDSVMVERVAVQDGRERSQAHIRLKREPSRVKEMILANPPRLVFDLVFPEQRLAAIRARAEAKKKAEAAAAAKKKEAQAAALPAPPESAPKLAVTPPPKPRRVAEQPQPEVVAKAKPAPAPKPLPEVKPAPTPKPEPVVEAKPTPAPKPIAQAKPAPKPVAEAKPVLKPEAVAEAKPAPTPVAQAKPAPKPVVEAKPVPIPKPEAKPEPKLALEPKAAGELPEPGKPGGAVPEAEKPAPALAEAKKPVAPPRPERVVKPEPRPAASDRGAPLPALGDIDWVTWGGVAAGVLLVTILLVMWLRRRSLPNDMDVTALAEEAGADEGMTPAEYAFGDDVTSSPFDRTEPRPSHGPDITAGPGLDEEPEKENEMDRESPELSREHSEMPTQVGVGAGAGSADVTRLIGELERRVAQLETRLDESIDARERLERQVAAQAEELRVQRAAIARTQRALRGLNRGEEEQATEPAIREPSS